MKLSLGMILALCLAGLQFVAVTIVVFSSFLTSEKVLLEHARELLSDVGTNTIEHSKGFLRPAKGAAELATRLAENQVIASASKGVRRAGPPGKEGAGTRAIVSKPSVSP